MERKLREIVSVEEDSYTVKSDQVFFRAFCESGEQVEVWLTPEQIERLYKRSKRPLIKGILMFLAEKL